MHRLSDNYYHRKCYFAREQVPTQTVMKNKMGQNLAQVYFNSMDPKRKVLAGLEPPLRGGGQEWYMPPEEILAGRHVLKPIHIKYLKKLSHDGINELGEAYKLEHYKNLMKEKQRLLRENDEAWMASIVDSNTRHYEIRGKIEAENNSQKLQLALHEFELMYRQSVTKINDMVCASAAKEVNRVRDDTFMKMKKRYAQQLDYQARMLYDHYEGKLAAEKASFKRQFIMDVENIRSEMGDKLHRITHDKHLCIEKLRHFLMCQNLSCQVYVALKEREACEQEMGILKKDHKKIIKQLEEDIAAKDYEIQLTAEQQKKHAEFIMIWKKKVCHIVKKFQMFVEYCLKNLPEQAEFFLNMEKLMLLQISEALENPASASIIIPSEKPSETKIPKPRPHPFYLFCDKGYKPQIDQNLCPLHCTSSASDVPVIVINKRYIYTSCDKYEKYIDKVVDYIKGRRGDDDDVYDGHDYDLDVPVNITSSQQLLELKLQSSLMQILQQEIPNIRELPIECGSCKLPYCFCSPRLELPKYSQYPLSQSEETIYKTIGRPGKIIETREQELKFLREPKWDSYFRFIEPKVCTCAKTAKKHLEEHLPPYMRQMSPYEPPELPHYQRCDLLVLKKMVHKARGLVTPPPSPVELPATTRSVGVQYLDTDFENLCICFSDAQLVKLFEKLKSNIEDTEADETKCSVMDASITGSYLGKTSTSFVTDRARSLRRFLDDKPSVVDIFKAADCNIYDRKYY